MFARGIALIVGLSVVPLSSADAHGPICLPVLAELNASMVTEPCPPIQLCTRGRIRGTIDGTTEYIGHDLALSAGMPNSAPAEFLSYAGQLTVTTRWGTLTTQGYGLFDTQATSSQEFSQMDRVVGGTGIFKNATGTLYFYGAGTNGGAGLASQVRGQICFAPPH